MNAPDLVSAARPSDVIALVVLVALFGLSIAAYGMVPAEMVIHYTPAGTIYYGPETLPKALGLFIVPVLAVVTYVGLRLPLLALGTNDISTAVGPYYQLVTMGILGMLGVVHVALILLNVA